MIQPIDDYPFHQAALPFSQTTDGDPNRYDRYFFHGYDPSQDLVFVVALGLYPNRNIIDAALCVSHAGVQHSAFASGRMRPDRATVVGPVVVEVVEPLRRLHVMVRGNDLPVAADITFTAGSVALQEPRQTMMDRNRIVLDSCRYTQFGRWTGMLQSHDTSFTLDAATTYGTRDRSWGIRPLAGATPAAPATTVPGIWWLWTPLQLDDGRLVHAAVQEAADGTRHLEGAAILQPVDIGQTWDNGDTVEHGAGVEHALTWEPGTRRARALDLTIRRRTDEPLRLHLEPIARVFMRGVGYTHLEWSHGAWHGEDAAGQESLVHADIQPGDFTTLHVQQLVRVSGDATGWGMAEQLHLGDHAPTGLSGFVDPVGA